MKTSRKIARSIVQTINLGMFVGVSTAASGVRFVADLMDEGIEAFDSLGRHIEDKIEEIDE